MARTNVPDSATAQFFINVVDNGMLNASGPGNGYAVFGKVDRGHGRGRQDPRGAHAPASPHADVPVEPVIIKKATLEK